MTRLADRADSYAMAKATVDGNVLLRVRETVAEAVGRARAGDGPTLIEALTYRHKGHSRSDPGAYRPPGELEAWLERDPITLFQNELLEQGSSRADLDALREEAERSVAEALETARAWPEPDTATLAEDVFS